MERQRKKKGDQKKIKNLLLDGRIRTDLEKLFDDLRGGNHDQHIDSSTVLFLLSFLNMVELEPEFFWYVYSTLQRKEKLNKEEFVALFMKPPKFKVEDPEDMKHLFQIFDAKGKGSFGAQDFLELFEYSPVYQANPTLVEDNVQKSFDGLAKLYGNREITPVEFFHILTQVSEPN